MIKDIVANLSLREAPDVAMDFAVSVAVAFNARLAGIAFVYEPIIPVMIDMYGIPPDVIESQRVESERAAKAAVARLDKAGRDAGLAAEAHMLDSAASTASQVETRIDKQSVEPGIEPVRIAKSAQVLPCLERRLLDRVARELRVPEDQPGGRVQSRKVRADEHAEGLMIALACPLDETCLVHGAPQCWRGGCRSYHSDWRR